MILQILTILAPAALTVATLVMPTIPLLLAKVIHIGLTAQRSQQISDITLAAATGMYGYFVTNKKSIHDPIAMASALTDAVNHVITSPTGAPAMKKMKLTPDHIETMIKRRFGAVLAMDPTVSLPTAIQIQTVSGAMSPCAIQPSSPPSAS